MPDTPNKQTMNKNANDIGRTIFEHRAYKTLREGAANNFTSKEKARLQMLLFYKENLLTKTYYLNKKLVREIKRLGSVEDLSDISSSGSTSPYFAIYELIECVSIHEISSFKAWLLRLENEVSKKNELGNLREFKKIQVQINSYNHKTTALTVREKKRLIKALNSFYVSILELELIQLKNEKNEQMKLMALEGLQNRIKNFKHNEIEKARFDLNKHTSLIEDSINNPIICQLLANGKGKKEVQNIIKQAQTQTAAIQTLLTLGVMEDVEKQSFENKLSQDLNSIEVKPLEKINKITYWWRWLVGATTENLPDMALSVNYFIRHPWRSAIFYAYQLRYWTKWLLPLWNDRELIIYNVLSTLYSLKGRDRIAALYDAIYENKFKENNKDVLAAQASIEFINKNITEENRKKYLKNELFLYALLTLCLEIECEKTKRELAIALNSLSREIGSNIAIDLGDNIEIHGEEEVSPAKIVLVAAINRKQLYLGNRIKRFCIEFFSSSVATIVAAGLLATIFASAVNFGLGWAGLSVLTFASPVGIAVFCIALAVALIAFVVNYNTYRNSITTMLDAADSEKITVEQPIWKKMIIWASLLLCIVAGTVIGGVITYAGIQGTFLFFIPLITGLTTTTFFLTFPAASSIFMAIALSIAIVGTIAEIALVWREFSKIVIENSFWDFLQSLREALWDCFIDAASEKDWRTRWIQYITCAIRIPILFSLVIVGTVGLVVYSSAAHLVTFNRDMAHPALLINWLTHSLTIATNIAQTASWIAVLVHSLFNFSLLMETAEFASKFIYGVTKCLVWGALWPWGFLYACCVGEGKKYWSNTWFGITQVFTLLANYFVENPWHNPFAGLRVLSIVWQAVQLGAMTIHAAGMAAIFPELPKSLETPSPIANSILAMSFNFWESLATNILATEFSSHFKLLDSVEKINIEKKVVPQYKKEIAVGKSNLEKSNDVKIEREDLTEKKDMFDLHKLNPALVTSSFFNQGRAFAKYSQFVVMPEKEVETTSLAF